MMCLVAILVILFVIGGMVSALTVLVVALRKAAVKAERGRRDALYAWTMTSGWQLYEGDVPTSWRQRLTQLPRFRIRRVACGVVHGLPVTAADCRYETHSTDAQGHTQTNEVNLLVLVARLPGRWPDIEVRNRQLGSRLLRALGRHSAIEIGHPPFDQRFRVQAADPQVARALLSPALVDAHLRGHAPQWSLHNGELMTVDQVRLTPDLIPPGVERLRWLAAMIGYRG
jgi:hypothetical protein